MANPWEMDWGGGAKPWEMSWPKPEAQSAGSRFVQGLRDPIDAGAQLLTKSLPDSVVGGINKATQYVNDLPVVGPVTKALGMTPSTPQQIDQGIAKRESEYRAPEGFDFARLGGNITTTLPMAAGMPVGAGLAGRAAAGAGSGGFMGLFSPVTENQDDFWSQKGGQVGTSAAAGGVLGPVLGGAARMIRPQTRPQAQLLLDEGVTPTMGDILGGVAQRTEEKLTSVPILGDAIKMGKRSAVEDLNRAAYRRAVTPAGGTVPDEVGREGVASVSRQLSDAYNRLLPNLRFQADNQFATELNTVRQMASTLPQAEAQQFENILRHQVIGKLTPQGLASGVTIKSVESELGRLANGYRGDPSFNQRQLGAAIQEVQSSIRGVLQRTNPQSAQELSQINQGFANYARIRDAASRQGSAEGVFTPAQLAAAVRKADKSVGHGNYARGTAMMQDLSDAGVNVLGSKYPDSGSIGRLLLGAGALGSGALNPAIPGALGLASLPYLPGGRQITAALLARRPNAAQPVANAVSHIPAGLLAPALYQGFQQ